MSILSKNSIEKIKSIKNLFVIINDGIVTDIGNMELVGFVEPDFDNHCLYIDYGTMWIRGDYFIPVSAHEHENDWEDFFLCVDEKRGNLSLVAKDINSKNTDWNKIISESTLTWEEM